MIPREVSVSFDEVDIDVFTSRGSTQVKPEPNPPFVFPMQSPLPGRKCSDDEDEVCTGSVTNRSSRTRARPQRISINASLSTFEFHPSSAEMKLAPGITPPESPMRSAAMPPRAAGHRRGGSEFIGGDGTSDGPGLMSTSPTKREYVLPQPQVSRLGPPGMRRGHAHRRSGAISSHDLSTISRPFGEPPAGSGSVPTTPSNSSFEQKAHPSFDKSNSYPLLSSSQSINDLHVSHDEPVLSTNKLRSRVGFSDTIEFIPRPLSTISSETSSSLSTIRAAHSVTGSITSIVSGGTPSPPSANKSCTFFGSRTEHNTMTPRPHTANAALEIPSSKEHSGDNAELPKRPSSAAASSYVSPGSRKLSALSSSVDCLSNGDFWQMKSQGTSIIDEVQTLSSRAISSSEDISKSSTPKGFRSGAGVTKPAQRNAKKWAGSILPRRGKQHTNSESSETRRSFAPVVCSASAEDENFSLDDVNFDEDNTYVIHDPRHDPMPAARIKNSVWNPHRSNSHLDSDLTSPMLDLDAALGPFNTPDNVNSSGFSSARRRMHSSGATGGFDGPGMHYHRRAESAPELLPIHYSTFGLHRLGSDPTMADVFEEDEENELISSELPTRKDIGQSEGTSDERTNGLGVQIVDVGEEEPLQLDRRRSGLKRQDCDKVTNTEVSTTLSPNLSSDFRQTFEEPVSVEIVEANEEPRFSMATKSSDESTVTPRLSLDPLVPRPNSAPLELTFPTHRQPFDTPETASSAVSSPDCASTSFDFPRLNTAHSSFTDRTTWSSSRGGDHVKEQGYSADDVPSLTSSISTMISAQAARASSGAVARPSGERASSLPATAPSRKGPTSAGKRSSLVSLSRLVGNSQGERSKLSIESHPQLDDPNRQEKKRGKRISRLLRFWSPKGKLKPL